MVVKMIVRIIGRMSDNMIVTMTDRIIVRMMIRKSER